MPMADARPRVRPFGQIVDARPIGQPDAAAARGYELTGRPATRFTIGEIPEGYTARAIFENTNDEPQVVVDIWTENGKRRAELHRLDDEGNWTTFVPFNLSGQVAFENLIESRGRLAATSVLLVPPPGTELHPEFAERAIDQQVRPSETARRIETLRKEKNLPIRQPAIPPELVRIAPPNGNLSKPEFGWLAQGNLANPLIGTLDYEQINLLAYHHEDGEVSRVFVGRDKGERKVIVLRSYTDGDLDGYLVDELSPDALKGLRTIDELPHLRNAKLRRILTIPQDKSAQVALANQASSDTKESGHYDMFLTRVHEAVPFGLGGRRSEYLRADQENPRVKEFADALADRFALALPGAPGTMRFDQAVRNGDMLAGDEVYRATYDRAREQGTANGYPRPNRLTAEQLSEQRIMHEIALSELVAATNDIRAYEQLNSQLVATLRANGWTEVGEDKVLRAAASHPHQREINDQLELAWKRQSVLAGAIAAPAGPATQPDATAPTTDPNGTLTPLPNFGNVPAPNTPATTPVPHTSGPAATTAPVTPAAGARGNRTTSNPGPTPPAPPPGMNIQVAERRVAIGQTPHNQTAPALDADGNDGRGTVTFALTADQMTGGVLTLEALQNNSKYNAAIIEGLDSDGKPQTFLVRDMGEGKINLSMTVNVAGKEQLVTVENDAVLAEFKSGFTPGSNGTKNIYLIESDARMRKTTKEDVGELANIANVDCSSEFRYAAFDTSYTPKTQTAIESSIEQAKAAANDDPAPTL